MMSVLISLVFGWSSSPQEFKEAVRWEELFELVSVKLPAIFEQLLQSIVVELSVSSATSHDFGHLDTLLDLVKIDFFQMILESLCAVLLIVAYDPAVVRSESSGASASHL